MAFFFLASVCVAVAGGGVWFLVLALSIYGRNLVDAVGEASGEEPGVPASESGPPAHVPPQVHVLVPARDEERDVESCLRSLLAQDYPRLRVVLVDDASQDATRSIAEALARDHPDLEVMEAGPLPEGWCGKPHALYQAWKHVRPEAGELLLFTDADVRLTPSAVSVAVRELVVREADLVSLLPHVEVRGFWEKVLQPAIANLIALSHIAGTLGPRDKQLRVGAGAFLMVRAEAYRRVGGHRGVRDRIVEDVALTTNLHRRGFRTETLLAPDLVRVRMYQGLGEIWRGWTKNMFSGHQDRLPWAAATAASLLASSILPPLLAPLAWWWGRPVLAGILAAVAVVGLLYRAAANRRMGQPLWPVVFHPLAALVLLGILVQSTWQRRFGAGARWRGRRYPMQGG